MSATVRKILLADNVEGYRRSLRALLELEGYAVTESTSLDEASGRLDVDHFDLVLADLRLTDDTESDFSGLELAKKAVKVQTPCIVITAYPSVETTRLALRSRGSEPLAVDYVPKEGGPQALLDAVQLVLGRIEAVGEKPAADLAVDLDRRLVSIRGQQLDISRQQYVLLAYLYGKAGAVCSPEELIKAVYDEEVPAQQASADRRLERLVERLRLKIEDVPDEPTRLLTVHGRGYRLEVNA